jgi:pullulanase
LLTKGQQKGLGLGVFNDQIRNELVGSVFSHSLPGFVTGAPNHVDTLKKSVAGSIHDFAAVPGETINYVTSHDNLTLWDKISASASGVSEQDRINMDKLAQAIIMTVQGVAFMQGGEEFLRTKGGNDNSYNAGDAINQFDWARKAQYQDVFDYYAGLIHLRVQHPAFRLTSAEQIDQCLTFLDSPDNTIAFSLNDHANGDPWRTIIVIYNPNRAPITVSLPPDPWTIVANQQHIDPTGLGQATTTVTVSPISCLILYQL